ncbi:putative copper resistance-related lipoprotein [Acidovorax delafieldii 2AN]|jgi:outer membrane protein TolC|uniref:Putative copper resistance-related lipoprotein n=1 Tax=Acidovorax delafieldii 2AN TaxID=573060 RepID=C5T302_ACIDE|nr:TolC family protein [Acidovorax delafieldii]EER61150.1 putative copper resistance-related lipoprotein [Acidovorax delafieldii 2AN]
MMRLRATHAKLALSALGLAVLTGCASVSLEQNIGRVNEEAGSFTDGKLALARTQEERDQRAQAAQTLLAETLNQKDAVQLALVNSPSLQTLLAQGWGESADAAQVGRIANPIFSFERMTAGTELDLGRALSFGLLDLLTLPSRYGVATRRIEQSQLRLTSDVVDQVTRVRQAWVRAVAAQQSLKYAKQVYDSAEAGAELAKRMQSVGNFNRITRAREQAFYADAATRLSTAQHQVTASREELVRLLGLDESQAQALKLPERLPDLPMQALDPQAVGSLATKARLDIRLAQTALDGAAKAQGLNMVTSFTDIELTGRRNTTFDNAEGTRSTARGWEIDVRLPLFDWGGMQRDAMNARTLAAANQLEGTVRSAGSSLRESYSAYRTAYDVARHYRDEVVPVRKVIAEENQLRYNGMLISAFELLADARDQVGAVTAALDSQQQFWLADAALQASVIGRPTNTTLSVTTSASSDAGAGH